MPAQRSSTPEAPRPELAYRLDATPVPLFSRGPSRRSGLCASDPDGGWYVREGDHREREDHKGRAGGRVAWALEATVLTTASPVPEKLASFPNLVVGLALGRPGTDPGGTAVRVLRGARARGWVPGPLVVDRADSGAFAAGSTCRCGPWASTSPSLPGRPTRPSGQESRRRHGRGNLVLPVDTQVLVNATIDVRAGRIDASTCTYLARADFLLRRKSGPAADGYERFMRPASGPSRRWLRPAPDLIVGPRPRDGRRRTTSLRDCAARARSPSPPMSAPYAQSLAFGTATRAAHYATLRNTIRGGTGSPKTRR